MIFENDEVQSEMQQVQQSKQEFVYQNVVVMRHGERKDNIEPLWAAKASRPWDPPLTDDGKVGAFGVGRIFRNRFDFPIHRVFVSPFLRCLQTANEVVSALCADDGDLHNNSSDPNALSSSSNVVLRHPCKIKVAVEYGLCEMLNSVAIRPEMAPKDGDFAFNISECEASLPSGTIDHSSKPVYPKLPQWGEGMEDAHKRYIQVIKATADKYPSENLLFVTHGEGLGASFPQFQKGTCVVGVEYCAYVHARRPVVLEENKSSVAEGSHDFQHVGHAGITFVDVSVTT